MFFILSKILAFIIQPIVWLVGLLAWAFFSKNAQKKLRILRGAFFFTLIVTNPFLLHQTFRLYETSAVQADSLRDTADIAIVLGGFSNFDVPANGCLNFNDASNRLTDALVLYKKGLVKKLLISGGDGNIIGNKNLEAEQTVPFLLALGVRQEDILLEIKSRNTHENALFSKQLIDNQQIKGQKILLITSAYHMRRSLACFRKVGMAVGAFPAHFIGKEPSWRAGYWLIPEPLAFFHWKQIIKEWVGYGVYWLKGYI
jgi:uncharacterized SAM-binding protein YcdF (DUF218 family)